MTYKQATDHLILVDENDNELGFEEKMKAHENGGKLHRAFSIFVFDDDKKMILQKRADSKYHCGGLWTNTCCSHPAPGESLEDAVHRRLKEEMGFDCELKEIMSFTYKASFENGLTEWEFDHVFIGSYGRRIIPDPAEVGDIKAVSVNDLKRYIKDCPNIYTPWFKIVAAKVIDYVEKHPFRNYSA
ncbi:MAG: isopentenyl-diphosphate Delta-isomerase [archaeon]|nr:isopentenyl-diphosphate Delta-isomerase [archaeon]